MYCQSNDRPGKPIRLMCGMLILKHLRNLSDESLVEQWCENAYYQYFCRMQEFTLSVPCTSSEQVHFRKRIGEVELNLTFGSIRVNNENDEDLHHDTAFIDSMVHEKDVTYPMDAKLHRKIIKKVLIIRSVTGIILGAMSFRNEYDGHSIGTSTEQVERLTGRKIKVLAGDRGY